MAGREVTICAGWVAVHGGEAARSHGPSVITASSGRPALDRRRVPGGDGREASTHFAWAAAAAAPATRRRPASTSRWNSATSPGATGTGTPGARDDRYPTTLVNSHTVSIEHHDNGGRTAGSGKGVVSPRPSSRPRRCDALLLRGDLAEFKAAGIGSAPAPRPRSSASCRAIPIDRHHVMDHHYIGRKAGACWRPWADDPVGFPQVRSSPPWHQRRRAGGDHGRPGCPSQGPSMATVPAGAWLSRPPALEPWPDDVRVVPSDLLCR